MLVIDDVGDRYAGQPAVVFCQRPQGHRGEHARYWGRSPEPEPYWARSPEPEPSAEREDSPPSE